MAGAPYRLELREDPAQANPHVVVVFLADPDSRVHQEALASVAEARARTYAGLPLVHAGVVVTEVVPKAIATLNAHAWEDEEAQAVQAILRLLGLIEQERN